MYVGRDFDPADPDESEIYAFDFVKDLAEDETISSAVWSCEVAGDSSGTDGGASSRLSGAPSNSGTVSSQRVAGLVAGVKYILQAVVTTNKSNQVSLWAYVTCNETT